MLCPGKQSPDRHEEVQGCLTGVKSAKVYFALVWPLRGSVMSLA